MGFLYATSAAWGIGTGVWIDSEAHIGDPGLMLILPAVFGAAAPVSMFLVDRFAFDQGMPEGLPSSIATGMIVGAGEGMGIASTLWVRTENVQDGTPATSSSGSGSSVWGFRGFARAEIIGSTAGGLLGGAFYALAKPLPENNLFITSAVTQGAIIGSFFGGGASNGSWKEYTNDGMSLGGTIGYNVALAGSVVASIAWTPSWNQIGWMWGGMGIGMAASLPVYIFYAADTAYDPRRGMVFQAVAGTLGLGLGLILGEPRAGEGGFIAKDKHQGTTTARNEDWIQLGGLSFMPVDHGVGAQAFGALF